MSYLLSYSVVMTTKTNLRDEPQLNEIDGYLELGMQGEALGLIRSTLEKKDTSEAEFNICVFALLQMDGLEQRRKPVEAAYARLAKPVDDSVRANMLNFYFSLGEPEKAFQFFPIGRPTRFFDLWVMMQVCLELDRLEEAKKIARLCSRLLAKAECDFTRASMSDALASHCLQIGEWETALELWREAPDEATFQRQKLCGIVKVHLLQALQAAKAGLAKVAAARADLDLNTEVQLPKNRATLLNDTERDLRKLQSAIEKLLPQAVLITAGQG